MQVKVEPISHWERAQRVANTAWGLKELRHRASMPVKLALARHLTVNWQSYRPAAAVSTVHALSGESMCLPVSVVQALRRRANEETMKLDRKSLEVVDAAFDSMQAHAVPDLPPAAGEAGTHDAEGTSAGVVAAAG